MSNVHRRRVNSPFNKEQEIWIILEFGSVRNISTVRRNFRKEFKITNVKLIPQRNVFQRLVDRFIDQSDTKPVAKTGGKQDGATVHTTISAREWLHEKFGQRVISRFTDRPWPAKSPDLSPLDYWFWSVAMQELSRNPPSSIEELKSIVEGFAASLDPTEVNKAVRSITKRAQACAAKNGGHFQHLLKHTNIMNNGDF